MWDPGSKRRIARHCYRESLGVLFASGQRAFSLYQHLKLIALVTGEIVRRWPQLSTGDGDALAAFDLESCSLAVATPEGLTVVQGT